MSFSQSGSTCSRVRFQVEPQNTQRRAESFRSLAAIGFLAVVRVPALARWLLGLGTAATLAANVAHGLGHGPMGATVGVWPAVTLVGSYELLMVTIRSAHALADSSGTSVPREDLLYGQAARVFAEDLAAARVPSIRARLHVGQPRAQRIRNYLADQSAG